MLLKELRNSDGFVTQEAELCSKASLFSDYVIITHHL